MKTKINLMNNEIEKFGDPIVAAYHVTYEFNWRCGIMPGITWRYHGYLKPSSKSIRIASVSSLKTLNGLSEKCAFLLFLHLRFFFFRFFDIIIVYLQTVEILSFSFLFEGFWKIFTGFIWCSFELRINPFYHSSIFKILWDSSRCQYIIKIFLTATCITKT